jgi:hypothetical protein
LAFDKKSPTVRRPTVGQVLLFSGGFEEAYVRPACHSRPSMVAKITGYSRKINVAFRKT